MLPWPVCRFLAYRRNGQPWRGRALPLATVFELIEVRMTYQLQFRPPSRTRWCAATLDVDWKLSLRMTNVWRHANPDMCLRAVPVVGRRYDPRLHHSGHCPRCH